MPNPFEQRATEYLRDDDAFLAVVTPEPLGAFFREPAEAGRLYDRLTMIVGNPGIGKTTLARLFEFPTISTLLLKSTITNYKPLVDLLTACGAIHDNRTCGRWHANSARKRVSRTLEISITRRT